MLRPFSQTTLTTRQLGSFNQGRESCGVAADENERLFVVGGFLKKQRLPQRLRDSTTARCRSSYCSRCLGVIPAPACSRHHTRYIESLRVYFAEPRANPAVPILRSIRETPIGGPLPRLLLSPRPPPPLRTHFSVMLRCSRLTRLRLLRAGCLHVRKRLLRMLSSRTPALSTPALISPDLTHSAAPRLVSTLYFFELAGRVSCFPFPPDCSQPNVLDFFI